MKRAAAALIVLMMFLSPAALAEGRSFALNREGRSDLYSWDGVLLTPPDTYLGIYSLTAGSVAPKDELFAAVSARQALPEGESAQVPFAILDAEGRPVPAYGPETIRSLARVFTGWTFATATGNAPKRTNPANWKAPLWLWRNAALHLQRCA